MPTLFPSLFIGLGGRGLEIAKQVSEQLIEANPQLAKLHRTIGVDASGIVRIGNISGGQAFEMSGLQTITGPGVWKNNYEVFLDYEDQFSSLLSCSVREVRKAETILELGRANFDVANRFYLYLFSTLFDPVGSALTLRVLDLCHRIIEEELNQDMASDLVLFSRDLFEESRTDIHSSIRSYTFLSELDWLRDPNRSNLMAADANLQSRYTWLLSNSNEAGEFLSSWEDLTPMIAETILLQLTGSIDLDQRFAGTIGNDIEGKTCHFGSFGLKKLLFPVDQVMQAIISFVSYNILQVRGQLKLLSVDRTRTQAIVRYFFDGIEVDKLPEQLLETDDGDIIWQDFRYEGRVDRAVDIGQFLGKLQEQIRTYERKTRLEQIEAIATRKASLYKSFETTLNNIVIGLIDNNPSLLEKTLGSKITSSLSRDEADCWLSRTEAFLAALSGNNSDVFKGYNSDEPMTIHDFNSEMREYFYKELGVLDDMTRLKKLRTELSLLDAGLETKVTDPEDECNEEDLDEASGEPPQTTSEMAPPNPEEEAAETDPGVEDINRLGKEIIGSSASDDESHASCRAALEEDQRVLTVRIEKADRIIDNVDECRRIIVAKGQTAADEQFNTITDELRQTDNCLIAAENDLSDLEEVRLRFLQRYFVIIPILLAVVTGLLWGINESSLWPFDGSIKIFSILFGISLIAYLIWAGLKYKAEIAEPLAELRQKIDSSISRRESLMIGLQRNRNDFLKLRFTFQVHCQLIELLNEAATQPGLRLDELRRFSKETMTLTKRTKSFWDNIEFPNNLFTRCVLQRDDVKRYINEYSSLQIEMQEFFKDKPLSAFFDDFRTENSIQSLNSRIEKYAEQSFSFVRSMTIDEAIKDRQQHAADAVARVVKVFFESISSFTSLNVEGGQDQSTAVVLVGVPNPADSAFRYILQEQGLDTDTKFHPFRSRTEIIALKLKIGFPAFYLSVLEGAHSDYNDAENRREYYCSPDWRVGNLIPLSALDQEHGPMVIRVCQALALKWLQIMPTGWGRDGKVWGDNLAQTVGYLKSGKGARDHLEIKAIVDNEMANSEVARVKIQNFLDTEGGLLDDTVKSILDGVLIELDPLA